MKVTLFTTCLADQLYPDVAASVVRVLRRLGCEVTAPRDAICCGQPAFNAGYRSEARRVAERLLEALAGADWVVTPSGSCAGMISHNYPALFQDAPALAREARALCGRIREFSQFLVEVVGIEERLAAATPSFPHRVTFQPSCHGARLLGAKTEPLRVLRAVPDLELVELPCADDCCGFGGTFAVKLGKISTAIVDEKVDHVTETEAEYITGTDLGCLMNIAGRMETRGVKVTALHLGVLLDRALHAPGGTP